MNKLILLCALAAASPIFAQTNTYVSSTGDVVLSAAATAATLQQPTATATVAARDVKLLWASVYCSVACTVTQTINGTGATTTAGTPVGVPGTTGQPAAALFYTASNFSGGTVLVVDHIPAGGTFTFDLSGIALPRAGTGSNYSISIGSLTGTVNITISHSEVQN